jgi:hypothetical protein
MTPQTEQNISHAAWQVGEAARACFLDIASYHATYAAALKPTLKKDGDMWCALHGDNLQVGIAGFGPTPGLALVAFDMAMCGESGSHVIERKVKP